MGSLVWLVRLFIFICLIDLVSCVSVNYKKDLDFIHNTIVENHPGVYNKLDLKFNANLAKFYSKANEKILQAKSNLSKKNIINEFTKNFNDTHLWINWRNSYKQYISKRKSRTFKIFRPFKNNNMAYWISLPSFDLNSEEQKDFNTLIEKISKIRFAKNIVFDLRGNSGGNSAYGYRLIQSLFGEDYTQQKKCLHDQKVFIDWRASEGNLEHILSLIKQYPKDGWLNKIKIGIKDSLKNNKKYYREFLHCNYEIKNSPPQTTAKVIVIIDFNNVSAALDFIDDLKMVTDDITLVGEKTKSDRLYMEVRTVVLPSKRGNLNFPIKVYRNRPRLDGQAYMPDIVCKKLKSTLKLKDCIKQILK